MCTDGWSQPQKLNVETEYISQPAPDIAVDIDNPIQRSYNRYIHNMYLYIIYVIYVSKVSRIQ
jgi:hypothetical protein